jgi:REP element-mobilizing transposase RayT
LKYPAVKFSGIQARAVSRGFYDYIQRSGLTVWACTVLPEHVHMVLARHALKVEQLVIQLKGAATRQLLNESLHPLAEQGTGGKAVPKCWGRGEWKVFLNSEADILRSIDYVEKNPLKEGKPLQRWGFVTAYSHTTSFSRDPIGERDVRAPLSGRG